MSNFKAQLIGDLLSKDLNDKHEVKDCLNEKINKAARNPKDLKLQLEVFQMIKDFVEVVEETCKDV